MQTAKGTPNPVPSVCLLTNTKESTDPSQHTDFLVPCSHCYVSDSPLPSLQDSPRSTHIRRTWPCGCCPAWPDSSPGRLNAWGFIQERVEQGTHPPKVVAAVCVCRHPPACCSPGWGGKEAVRQGAEMVRERKVRTVTETWDHPVWSQPPLCYVLS